MAKEIITRITDDLDGTEADETVKFALDSIGYEIDLNDKNAAKLREFLQQYIDSGTRIGRVSSGFSSNPVGRPRSAAVSASNRDQNKAIRDWAIQAGYQLSERGRIPQTIQDAFADRHTATRKTTATLFQEPARQEAPAQQAPAAEAAAPKTAARKSAAAKKAATASA